MKSFTELRNLYGTLTNDSASGNLTVGDELINDGLRSVYGKRDWSFLDGTATATTETDNNHELPNSVSKIKAVTVTIGTTKYTPKEAPSLDFWNRLNQSTQTSNVPSFFFVFAGTLRFYPGPASATAAAVRYDFRRKTPNLSMADYPTGSGVTVTNGGTTVTGTGTTFTAPMVGRFLRVTETNTAGAAGDAMWYEIASVTSTTVLELRKPYLGTTVSSATAYAIGQMSLLPDENQQLPLWYALREYYTTIHPDVSRATLYRDRFAEGFRELEEGELNKTLNPTIELDGSDPIDSNLFITA